MPYKTGPIVCGMHHPRPGVRGARGGVRAARAGAGEKSDRRRHREGRSQAVAGHRRAEQRAGARRRHARDSGVLSAASMSARRGRAARDFVRGIIGKNVWLINVTHGKFGRRVVASVWLADGRDLATLLIATGHGRPYRGGRRSKWC